MKIVELAKEPDELYELYRRLQEERGYEDPLVKIVGHTTDVGWYAIFGSDDWELRDALYGMPETHVIQHNEYEDIGFPWSGQFYISTIDGPLVICFWDTKPIIRKEEESGFVVLVDKEFGNEIGIKDYVQTRRI